MTLIWLPGTFSFNFVCDNAETSNQLNNRIFMNFCEKLKLKTIVMICQKQFQSTQVKLLHSFLTNFVNMLVLLMYCFATQHQTSIFRRCQQLDPFQAQKSLKPSWGSKTHVVRPSGLTVKGRKKNQREFYGHYVKNMIKITFNCNFIFIKPQLPHFFSKF